MTGIRRLLVEKTSSQTARRDPARTSRRRRGRPGLFDRLERRELLSTLFTVNNLSDAGTGSGNSGDLRYCITQADAVTNPAGSVIQFDPKVFANPETITLTKGPLELSDTAGPVTIDGPAAALTVNGNGASRVFQVDYNVSATITGLTITGGSSAANGGGVYNQGSLRISDCTITDNSAAQGGGIEDNGGATITDCTISGNSARNGGGGLISYETSTTITGCTISGNTAHNGGGVDNAQGTVSLTDCTIAANSASSGGGGWLWGTTTMSGATVSGNSASSGGGFYMYKGAGTLTDAIVAGNTGAGEAASDIGESTGTVTGTNNLIGNGGSDGLVNGQQGNQVGVTTLGLGTLGNYGGATATIPLLPGSPELGTGTAINGVTTDQRGEPLDSQPDIGAFQSQGFTLTPAAGSTPQVLPPGTAFSPLALTVTANDPLDPVAGGVVDYTANAATSGASATLSATTATIGQGGAVQVGATANASYGTYTVTAKTATGSSTTATFDLSNLTPVAFSGLSSPTIAYGTATVTLGGTLSYGTLYPPSGESVTISIGSLHEPATIGANGAFSIAFPTASLAAAGSPHAVAYSYAGDGPNAPATAGGTLTVTALTPTVKVADAGGTFGGGSFAGSATVAAPGGTAGPSLEGVSPVVTYYSGSYTTAAQLSGVTPLAGAPSQAGTYTALASFAGSADYAAARSTPVTFTIQPAGTSVALVASGSSSVFGQPVTLTATVSSTAGGVPGGMVTFLDGTSVIGSVPLNGSGVAQLTLSSLGVGGHSFTASFVGGGNYLGGTSGAVPESVGQDGTQIVLAPKAVLKKKKVVSVVLNVDVDPVAPGAGTPTGSVVLEQVVKKRKTFTDKPIATLPLAGGVGTMTFKPKQLLKKTFVLIFGGDLNFATSKLSPPEFSTRSLARGGIAMEVSPIVGAKHPRGGALFRTR